MAKATKQRLVHGDDLLYRFFLDLFADDSDLAQRLPTQMLATMGIWLPLGVYHDWPIMLPWVVRDSSCRGNKKKGIPDAWSSPNELGFLRDDNSLIKGLPKSLSVATPERGHLSGARMGNEFVASHVWREVDHEELASRVPLLNSFVPNLVWLPAQVSKLSDREGSPVQRALQALSWRIYRDAPVAPHLRNIVEEAWQLIPEPEELPELPDLNWFEPTKRFFATRQTRLQSVINGLERLNAGLVLDKKVVSSRYTEGLPRVDGLARAELLEYLRRFVEDEGGQET